MALLFMDSFDHYATADIAEKWTSVANMIIGAYGRNSTNGLRGSTAFGTGNVTATVLGGVAEVIVAFAIKPITVSSGSAIVMLGSASNWECGLALNPDYTLQPCRGDCAPGSNAVFYTLLGSPSAVALQNGVWSYVEVRLKCDNSAGTCTVRVNGIEVLALTGLDTLGTSAVLTRFGVGGCHEQQGLFQFDDLVVMDTTGSLNNTFLGDVTVSALYPNGGGNSTDWDDSTGASPQQNWANVNESSPNDDTDYNSTSTVGSKDTYAMQNCTVGADIKAVQVLAAVKKASEGPGQVKFVVRSNGTDYDGAAKGIAGTTYSYVREVYETDPGSGSPLQAWTESGWNAVEIGIKKTA